ncbi:hypothetical protein FB451DRAFT_1172621 [Mycena latifolia]|nr:hypothetical protein FB451DRAFT_1172621 [Mycena latifolia]
MCCSAYIHTADSITTKPDSRERILLVGGLAVPRQLHRPLQERAQHSMREQLFNFVAGKATLSSGWVRVHRRWIRVSRRVAAVATSGIAFALFALYNEGARRLNGVNMTSAYQSQNQPPAAPFAISMRRRTILACSNCRKRKIRCITTEQPPKNPCARCVKKGLTCEYVAAPEGEEHLTSASRPQTPDASGAHRENSRANSGHLSAPMNPAAFSGGSGRGAAPPLPYTGPPPVTRTTTGWGYVPPSLRGPSHPSAANARASTSGTGSHQPYAHPQYYPGAPAPAQYAPGYPNPGYDPQYQYNMAAPGYGSQPPFMPPQAGAESFDYSEFLNDYEDPGQSSSRGYPSNDPRYNH